MDLICKKLSATDETIRFLSPFFEKKHVKEGQDDFLNTCYGIYRLFFGIVTGEIRVYGVFDQDPTITFLGFNFGYLDETGDSFEAHSCWDRGVPTAECANLCLDVMKGDYLRDGIVVKSVVCYIPDRNRAAQLLARRFGCLDCGFHNDKLFYKNGSSFPCREFRRKL